MIATSAIALVALLCSVTAQDAADDPATAVARLLTERCADCHSADSDEPKARKAWVDAGDLALTARNPKLITPGDPDDSDLFASVSFDDMPPPDSDVAQFTEDEKALLESWIKDGAVVPEPEPAADEPGTESTVAAAVAAAEASDPGWMRHPITRWASHHHPIAVHFPIALLMAALLAELLGRAFKRPQLLTTATFCLTLGALSALPAAGLGWLLAEQSNQHVGPIFWHRWLGVATAVLSVITLLVGFKRPGIRLVLLLVVGALVSLTGHLGGTLSYGADWLQFPTLP